MRYAARRYTLTGKFDYNGDEQFFSTFNDALNYVKAYAEGAGFTNVKTVENDDPGCYRVTATTPGGRPGRNIGTVEPDISDELADF